MLCCLCMSKTLQFFIYFRQLEIQYMNLMKKVFIGLNWPTFLLLQFINKGTILVNGEKVKRITLQNEQINSIEHTEMDKDFDIVRGQFFNLTHLSDQ